MSLSSNFPTIRPSLLLDFANVGRLDPRVTFTRATTATYYDGVTTAKAEENLLTYSQEFENAVWVNQNTTETANSTTAPDGTSTADTLDDGVATGVHDIGENFSGVSGTTYTLSAFFKDVNRQYVILACSASPSAWASAKFDLTAGTAGSTSASGAGWSTTSSSITSVGNSWYRCTITFVSGSTATLAARIGMATDSTTFTAGERGLQSYTGTNATIYIWGAQLEQRSSVTAYTATTTQAITNYIPVLLTAQNDVPRFDHNPTTGAALGLLIEEQRTNLLTYSEDFANAAWSNLNVTVTTNQSVAPDGTLSADLVVPNTTNAAHRIRQDASLTSGTSYSNSMYFKAAGYNWIYIQLSTGFDSVGSLYRNVNISDGTLGTGTLGANDVTVSSVGNGWYRVNITRTATSTTTGRFNWVIRDSDGATTSFAGDDYKGVFVWGAQLEAGAFPTSYIATTTTALTRNADVASMTGTNFSSWFNNAEGTVYAEAATNGTASTGGIFRLVNIADTTRRMRLSYASGTTLNFAVTDSTTQVSLNLVTGLTVGSFNKGAVAYKINDFAGSANGLTALTDTVGTVPAKIDQFVIGQDGAAASTILNGTIRRIAYYPTRLTDAQLQALTG